MNETHACIALNMLPKIGPIRFTRLLDHFQSATNTLNASVSELLEVPGISPHIAQRIHSWNSCIDLSMELDAIQKNNVHVITRDAPYYPDYLRKINDPPIVLYVSGQLSALKHRSISIVGTRNPSHYGKECARQIAYQLALAGLTTISGLARGIDTLVHQASLAAERSTIAIIGSGINKLYPPQNLQLAKLISEKGAIVSEFPMETSPDRQTFPMRNRLVSGWSSGTLIIECGRNSGAMITSNFALEQGRSIYAVPAPINRISSQGCNYLIQQGARLVMSVQDIFQEFEELLPPSPSTPHSPSTATLEHLSQNEQIILTCLHTDLTSPDEIHQKSGLPIHIVSSTLLSLELKQLVKQLPGNYFVPKQHQSP